MKERIVAILLSLTMIIGLGGAIVTPAKAAQTKTVARQVTDILDAKNATVTANFKANVKEEEATAQIYKMLKKLAFEYSRDHGSYEEDKFVFTKEGEAFYNRMLKLGIAAGLDEEGYPLGADVLDLQGTIKAEVADSQNFTLDLYLKIAKGESAKLISLGYNNGKIKINLGEFVKYVSEYTGRTMDDVYDAIEVPAIEELTMNGISELNKLLKSEIKVEKVLSYKLYTEEDGEEFADRIGQIKDVVYGETIHPNFNISSTQLMNTGRNLLSLALNTTDFTFSKFETGSGTKSTISINEKNAMGLISGLSQSLNNNSETIVNTATDEIMKLPGFDEIAESYPKGFLDALKKEKISQIKYIAKSLEEVTKEQTIEDEEGNITKYIPIERIIETNNIKAALKFSADTKGEKGYRDALFTGNIKFSIGKNEASALDLSFDVSVKEKGTKNSDANPVVKKVKKGDVAKVKSGTYVVTSTSKKTVSLKTAKNLKTVTVPSTITIGKDKYKVTSIGKNAFKKCSKTKKIVLGKNIKKVGKNAFKGINKKATIKCPKKSLKKYKKMIMKKSTGYKDTMTIK